MNILNQIIDNNPEEEFLIADGLDDAVIGYEPFSNRLIYSVAECISILENDMTFEDAIEHFNYNVLSAYVGEQTPIWCWDLDFN